MASARWLLLLLAAPAWPSVSAGEFEALVRAHSVYSSVQLRSPTSGGERGLWASRDVAAGEPLVAVPWSLCLLDEDMPGDARLDSPFEVEVAPARDVRLAGALLAAAKGDAKLNLWDVALHGSEDERTERVKLWHRWAPLLPRHDQLCLPQNLPAELLAELHDTQLVSAASLQRARVSKLVAARTRGATEGDGATSSSDCELSTEQAKAWEWAVALTSSRPFRMSLPSKDLEGTSPQLTAFVPFVDMANHEDDPSCEVQGRVAQDGSGFVAVALVARRNLSAGEEVTLSYFGPTPNTIAFCNFGFVPRGVNRHDRLGVPSDAQPLSATAVKETVRLMRQQWEGGWPPVRPREGIDTAADGAALLEAALLSLPLSRDDHVDNSREAARADALLGWLNSVAAQDFATTLEEDEAWLERHSVPPGAAVWANEATGGAWQPSSTAEAGGADACADAGTHLGSSDKWSGANRQATLAATADCLKMMDGQRDQSGMDPRLPDIVEYRVQRKRLWKLATEILTVHSERCREERSPR